MVELLQSGEGGAGGGADAAGSLSELLAGGGARRRKAPSVRVTGREECLRSVAGGEARGGVFLSTVTDLPRPHNPDALILAADGG